MFYIINYNYSSITSTTFYKSNMSSLVLNISSKHDIASNPMRLAPFGGKYGLKNRSEALNRFILEYGGDFVEPKIDEKEFI